MKVSFHMGRRITMVLLGAGLVALVIALALGETSALGSYVAIAGVVLFIVGMGACVTFCKCPYCNRVILRKMFIVTDCPHCKRNLETGLKGKSKKK